MDSTKHNDQEIHKSVVIPYIKAISENIKKRFDDKVAAMCNATSIFDPKKVKDDVRYGMTEVIQLASLHSSLNVSDLQDEWKTFQIYLKLQAKECPTAKLVLQKMAFNGFKDNSCLPSWCSLG